MMIGNPFLTISKAKWSYPGFFHVFLINQGAPKDDLGGFVLVCLTLNTETPFQQFQWVVSTISLLLKVCLFFI